MRYVLTEEYRLRGYRKLPTGLVHMPRRDIFFFSGDNYRLLLDCDGMHEMNPDAMTDKEKEFLRRLEENEVIRPALPGEMLTEKQVYHLYPAEYRRTCQWSITGGCNLRCRHCFMSAPHAKHGVPSFEQLVNIAGQLAECGVMRATITGGEPLTRKDFIRLMDVLNEREIEVPTIFTNGWLVDEALLDALDERGMHPSFQLSFDGPGRHDFLRGVPGAEERTLRALELLKERKHTVSVSMCLHKGNADTIRESVNMMAGLGVTFMKVSPVMDQGEWMEREVRELKLSDEEAQEAFCAYIPQFFADDAPMSLMLGGSFVFDRPKQEWNIYHEIRCTPEEEEAFPSCGVLAKEFFISAEGRVAPCMSMDDCDFAEDFPNLFEKPLKEILFDSPFTKLEHISVRDVRDANPKCRECPYVDRCTGGCRNSVLLAGNDYNGIDPFLCRFFGSGWAEQIHEIAEPAYRAYLARHPGIKPE